MIQKRCFNNHNLKMSIMIGFFYLNMEGIVQRPTIGNISNSSSFSDILQVVMTW